MSGVEKLKRDLYACTTPSDMSKELGYFIIKIGMSNDIEARYETFKTAKSEKLVDIGRWHNLKKIKTDFPVHRVLKRLGLHVSDASGNEFFRIPATNIQEAFSFIDNIITELEGNIVRDNVKLRKIQDKKIAKIMSAVKKSLETKKIANIVANLCPRFGKTIFALYVFYLLMQEYNSQIMLVPAYWLGVHSSFADELNRFTEFLSMTEIDVDDPDCESFAKEELALGRKLVIPVSLCGSDDETWQNKHRWITELNNHTIFSFFDEGDFGTHTDNQKTKIEFLLNNDTNTYINVFASGTNVQRLAQCTKNIDAVIFAPYCELEQSDPTAVRRKFYGTNVSGLAAEVEATINAEVMASWAKIWAKPFANKTFIEQLFISLVGGDEMRPELNLSNLTGEDIAVFMTFISANNKEMNQVKKIIETTTNPILKQYGVIVLNGQHTSNEHAAALSETYINESRIAGKKGVIIISNQMGSRSYSVPEIQSTVLAFDRGSVDATAQKASRCLTPTTDKRKLYDGVSYKKYGYIVDLSFDPNRNENLEKIVIDETVQVIRDGENGKDMPKATRFFFNSVNMFRVNSFGYPEEITEEDMFKLYSDNEMLLRVADVSIDIDAVTDELLEKFQNIQDVKAVNSKAPSATKSAKISVKQGSAHVNSNPKSDETLAKQELINRACRVINASATNVGLIVDGESYRECIKNIIANSDLNNIFLDRVGITADTVIEILEAGVFPNEPILDCIVQNTRREQPSMNFFK